jgi:putative addiction module killer protein
VVLFVVPQILTYVNAEGVAPYAQWHERLDSAVRARVTAAVYRLEAGNFSAAKGAGSGIFELRLDFGPGYRVYFGKDGDALVILLGGGTKKRQQADIDAAQALWKEYKQRKEQRRDVGTHKKV